jgi:hypothetical protein
MRFEDITYSDPFGNGYSTGSLDIYGNGVSIGGGFQYFFSPGFALNTGLDWTFGTFSDVEFSGRSTDDLDLKATTARLNLGLMWYPGGGR